VGLLQELFDRTEHVLVPGYPVTDAADGGDALLGLFPGNDGREPWPWIARSGLILHQPSWHARQVDIVRQITAGTLLVQIVRNPRLEIVELYRKKIRGTVMTLAAAGQNPESSTWLERVRDLDAFLAAESIRCCYAAEATDFGGLFRQHLVFDALRGKGIEPTIARLCEALDIPVATEINDLRRYESPTALDYLRSSETTLNICGLPLPVMIAYTDDSNPKGNHSFDLELSRVEASDAIADKRITFALEPRQLSLRVSTRDWVGVPTRVRRRLEREGTLASLFRETLLPNWFVRAEAIHQIVQRVLAQIDLDYLRRRVIEIIAPDLEKFLQTHPDLREAWAL
jgi:hypothetical protein